ncbi:MAG: hypothetical protein QOF80_2113 [Verrucomicrobiota bacterium]
MRHLVRSRSGLALPRVPWLSERTHAEDMRPHRVQLFRLKLALLRRLI